MTSRAPRAAPAAIEPTAEQSAIVAATDATIIIRANAGAAKTTTLALCVLEALRRGARPEGMLVLVFSLPGKKALRLALGKVGVDAAAIERLRLSTFDEFASDVLLGVEQRKVAQKETPEAVRPFVDKAIRALDMSADSGLVERFLAVSRRLKGTLRLDLARWEGDGVVDDVADDFGLEPALLRLFRAYEHIRYAERDGVDRPIFRWGSDSTYDLARLIADPDSTIRLLELTAWPRHIDDLLVDEMHDMNRAMFEIVRALLKGSGVRFCGVGDFDQVIHDTDGAEQRFMESDVDLGPGRRVRFLPLTATRRFARPLALLAQRLADKPYVSQSLHDTRVNCLGYGDDDSSGCARLVVEQAKHWKQASKGRMGEFIVLLRSSHQSVSIENALLQAGQPYRTAGFESYLVQPEVLLVRALLAVATDDFSRFESATTRRALVRALVFFCGVELDHHVSETETPEERLRHAIAAVEADAASLGAFFEFQVLRHAEPWVAKRLEAAIAVARSTTGPDMFANFLDALQIGAWVRSVFVERQRQADAFAYLEGLKSAARSFETAGALFESLNRAETRQKQTKSSRVTKISGSLLERGTLMLALIPDVKGLEFEQVVIPFLARDAFPARHADSAADRNLFYVAITRARAGLTLIVNRDRPSPFIEAIGLQIGGTSPTGSTATCLQ